MCGKQTEPDARFCGVCGAALTGGEILDGPELYRVGFLKAIKLAYANTFKYSGRATRAEAWWWVLYNIILCVGFPLAATIVMGDLEAQSFMIENALLFGIVLLVMCLNGIVGISLSVRRLHDSGKSGWLFLIVFIPILGLITNVILMCLRGDKGPNKYGPDPRTTPR